VRMESTRMPFRLLTRQPERSSIFDVFDIVISTNLPRTCSKVVMRPDSFVDFGINKLFTYLKVLPFFPFHTSFTYLLPYFFIYFLVYLLLIIDPFLPFSGPTSQEVTGFSCVNLML